MNVATLPLAKLYLVAYVQYTRRVELFIFGLHGPQGQRMPVGAAVSMN